MDYHEPMSSRVRHAIRDGHVTWNLAGLLLKAEIQTIIAHQRRAVGERYWCQRIQHRMDYHEHISSHVRHATRDGHVTRNLEAGWLLKADIQTIIAHQQRATGCKLDTPLRMNIISNIFMNGQTYRVQS